MQRRELELEKNERLAEIAERKEMQEMEARLAHAELIEQYEVDSDDQISEGGDRELNITGFDYNISGPNDDVQEPREAERRDVEQRDAERRDAERRDVEQRDAERRDAERREVEQQDAERREAE